METYEQAKERAQRLANLSGCDYGIEQLGNYWHVFLLPARAHRSGYALRCEVVTCEVVQDRRLGHGPVTEEIIE